jgi:hypothetical protein
VLFFEWRSHASLYPITTEEYSFFDSNISVKFQIPVQIAKPIIGLVPSYQLGPLSDNKRFFEASNTGRGGPDIDPWPNKSQISHSVNPDDPNREILLFKKQMALAVVAKYEKDALEKSRTSSVNGWPKSDINVWSEYERNTSTKDDSIEPMSVLLKKNYGSAMEIPGSGRRNKSGTLPPEISNRSVRVKKSRGTPMSGVRDYGRDQDPTDFGRPNKLP